MENLINIPGRLHSVAIELHVAGANEIYDDNLNKLQDEINSILVTNSITNVQYIDGLLRFYNSKGHIVKVISTPQEQSDYAETDSSKATFIKNKPTIPTKTSDLTNDSGFITDISGKQDVIQDLDDIRAGAALGATSIQEHLSLASLVDNGSYNSNDKTIELKHGTTVLSTIDATAFIKDGMVDSVTISDGYLVITFNTDAGKEAISLALTDIFNPANYYDKTAVNALLNGRASKESLEEVIRKAFMDANNSETITDSDNMMHFILSGTGTLADSELYTTSRYAYIDTWPRTIGGIVYEKTIRLSGFSSYPTFYIHCPFGGQLYLPILTDDYARFTIVGHHINKDCESSYTGTFEVDAGEDISITHTGREKRIWIGEIKLTYKDYLERTTTITLLNNKVDKVTGKGLSTEDYTTAEKNKLAGIAAGAEVNVQSDWNEADTSSKAYINNKPTIPDISNCIQKSSTTGLVKNDGSIDTNTYLTQHQDISGKADKVSGATNGNFAALDSNGNLTDSGHKHSDYLTSHQDLSNYVQKSNTQGLLKNDGTVDTTQYLSQHQDISGKEDITPIEAVVSGTTAITAQVNKYYEVAGTVSSLTVTLPTPTTNTEVTMVVVHLTIGNNPAIVVTSVNEVVRFSSAYSVTANKEYELSCLYNGSKWIVSSMEVAV